uniref:(California timema) hypothetical protein n=1 Tax=Timema californicum TaxID=61474 RepID=A0A7R9IYB1_TIMCA|nr:unnamed protein product [Timema californicum]
MLLHFQHCRCGSSRKYCSVHQCYDTSRHHLVSQTKVKLRMREDCDSSRSRRTFVGLSVYSAISDLLDHERGHCPGVSGRPKGRNLRGPFSSRVQVSPSLGVHCRKTCSVSYQDTSLKCRAPSPAGYRCPPASGSAVTRHALWRTKTPASRAGPLLQPGTGVPQPRGPLSQDMLCGVPRHQPQIQGPFSSRVQVSPSLGVCCHKTCSVAYQDTSLKSRAPSPAGYRCPPASGSAVARHALWRTKTPASNTGPLLQPGTGVPQPRGPLSQDMLCGVPRHQPQMQGPFSSRVQVSPSLGVRCRKTCSVAYQGTSLKSRAPSPAGYRCPPASGSAVARHALWRTKTPASNTGPLLQPGTGVPQPRGPLSQDMLNGVPRYQSHRPIACSQAGMLAATSWIEASVTPHSKVYLYVMSSLLASRCLLLVLLPSLCCAALFGRPHIIFILADDMGWNDVSFHGSDQIPTPNIDALAFNGVILNSQYAQPVCTPSRAALMTGKYPIHTGETVIPCNVPLCPPLSKGMQGYPLLAAEPRGLPPGKLLPEYLRELGYTNRAIGKWHLGFYKRELTPTYRGFDSHLGYWTGFVSYYDYILQDKVGEIHLHIVYKDGEFSGFDLRRNLTLARDLVGQYATDVFTDEAVRLISTHRETEPLFLYLAHLAPHAGNRGKLLEAPQEVVNKFDYIADPNRRTYAAMVSKLDDSVGRVTEALQRRGMLGDSIIVFMSDNGGSTIGDFPNWGSNYPLRGLKDTLWEGGVRVPGFIWSPLLQQTPRVSNQVMHITDWLPTLYTAAGGIPPLKGLDGVDQWEALLYDLPSPRREVLLNINEKTRTAAVRYQNYKLIIVALLVAAPSKSKVFNVSGSTNPDYNEYFGANWAAAVAPPYNSSAVTGSPAGVAVAQLYRSTYRSPTLTSRIPSLRWEASLQCTPDSPGSSCDPTVSKGGCVYDVERDPCETNDLAVDHPDLASSLRALLVRHRRTLVPQGNLPTDSFNADPAKWGGAWTTWGSGE